MSTRVKTQEVFETEDLAADYLDFCQHLADTGNTEYVPLKEFARMRNEEFLLNGNFINPIPSIH